MSQDSPHSSFSSKRKRKRKGNRRENRNASSYASDSSATSDSIEATDSSEGSCNESVSMSDSNQLKRLFQETADLMKRARQMQDDEDGNREDNDGSESISVFQWSEVVTKIRGNLPLCKHVSDKSEFDDGSDDYGRCLLHWASEKNAPMEIVNMLLELYKPAAKIKSRSKGHLPLHKAVAHDPSTRLVKSLIEVYSEGAKIPDRRRMLPLHLALQCEVSDVASLDVVKALIQANKHGVKAKDEHQQLPLHHAVKSEASIEIINVLLGEYPLGAQDKNEQGYLPLHLAAQNGSSIKVIGALIKAYPESIFSATPKYRLPFHFVNKKDYNADEWAYILSVLLNPLIRVDRANILNSEDGKYPLHYALEFGASLENLHELIHQLHSANQNAIMVMNKDGKWPLHIAAQYKSPIDVVSYLIENYPPAASTRDNKHEQLPLHFAIRSSASEEIIKELREQFPAGETLKDKDGKNALHHAALCDSDIREKLISTLLDSSANAANVQDISGNYPLHYVLQKGLVSLAIVKRMIKIAPNAVKVKFKFGSGPRNDLYPLTLALKTEKIDWNIVHELFTAYPDAVSQKDSIGRHAIHHAAKFCAPSHVLSAMLQGMPNLARASCDSNMLPLHLASKYGASCDVVSALTKVYPEAVAMLDKKEKTPLHYACQRPAPPQIIDQLLRVFPPGIALQPDASNKYPLNIAMNMKKPDWEIVGALIRKFPDPAKEIDREDGSLPLHAALRHGSPFEVVSALLKAFPKGAQQKDKDEMLPLHYALQIDRKRKDKIKILTELLDAYPDGAKRSCDGEYPLHIALEYGGNLEIVRKLIDLYKKGVEKKNFDSCYPLHVALKNGASVEVVQDLINLFAGATRHADDQGFLPLHYAAKFGASLDVVKVLCKSNTQGISEETENGEIPLYLAVSSAHNYNKPEQVVTLLLEKSQGRVDDQKLFFTLHIAIKNWAPLKIIQCLIDAFPMAVNELDDDEKVPLWYATKDTFHKYSNRNTDSIEDKSDEHDDSDNDSDNSDDSEIETSNSEEDSDHSVKGGALRQGSSEEKTYNFKNFAICQLLYKHTNKDVRNAEDYDRDALIRHAKNPMVRVWARTIGCKYNRYRLTEPVVPVYESETCEVYYATDEISGRDGGSRKVCLKFVHNRESFERERAFRKQCNFSSEKVVKALAYWSKDKGLEEPGANSRGGVSLNGDIEGLTLPSDVAFVTGAPTWETNSEKEEYAIVLDRADMSLLEFIDNRRIAGRDVEKVKEVALHLAEALKELHKCNLVHCDVKPRNLVRHGYTSIEARWKLIDLDASSEQGALLTKNGKYSSGYCAPEMANFFFNGEENVHVCATPLLDIWSFGVTIYRLCYDMDLFSCYGSSDNIIESSDLKRLQDWKEPPFVRQKIFSLADASYDNIESDALDLIEWCLQGDPAKRPQSMDDILKHKMLQLDRTKGILRRKADSFDVFISHRQAAQMQTETGVKRLSEGEDLAAEIYTFFKTPHPDKGLKKPLVMFLDKRYRGNLHDLVDIVARSRTFLFILSETVLHSAWCMLELLSATLNKVPMIFFKMEGQNFNIGEFHKLLDIIQFPNSAELKKVNIIPHSRYYKDACLGEIARAFITKSPERDDPKPLHNGNDVYGAFEELRLRRNKAYPNEKQWMPMNRQCNSRAALSSGSASEFNRCHDHNAASSSGIHPGANSTFTRVRTPENSSISSSSSHIAATKRKRQTATRKTPKEKTTSKNESWQIKSIEHLKRPPSAFIFFSKEIRRNTKGLTSKDISTKWHALSDEEKLKYEAIRKINKKKYDDEKKQLLKRALSPSTPSDRNSRPLKKRKHSYTGRASSSKTTGKHSSKSKRKRSSKKKKGKGNNIETKKRALSAFMWYQLEVGPQVRKDNPALRGKVGSISKIISKMWRSLSSAEKEKFEAKHRAEKAGLQQESSNGRI